MARDSKGRHALRGLILLVAVVITIFASAPASQAVSQASVDSGYSAVGAAFAATQSAEREGGNVTSLVLQLNGALTTIQNAEAVNATNPALATAEVANATLAAQAVVAAAGPVGEGGTAAKHLQIYTSIGSATTIVIVAALIYALGGRIYRRVWLRVYEDHLVKKLG